MGNIAHLARYIRDPKHVLPVVNVVDLDKREWSDHLAIEKKLSHHLHHQCRAM